MRRKSIFVLIRVAAVLLLTVGLILLSGSDPIQAVRTFFFGIFGTLHGFAEVFVRATPLIKPNVSIEREGELSTTPIIFPP